MRWKSSAQRFIANAPLEVYKIYEELHEDKFRSKGTSNFTIRERGKVRHIQAVHISERIVQKCLCNYALSPLMEKSLIYDNGASQKGKGTEFARQRLYKHLQQYYRHYGAAGYVLKFDFKGYFDSIPHQVVIEQIQKLDLDDKTKALAIYLIKQNTGEIGLGIGAEISQVLGVTYATSIDHIIKDKLSLKYYGRYMDDGYILYPDKKALQEILQELKVAVSKIGGKFNEQKTQIIKLSKGFEYLKTRYYLTETGVIVCKPNKKNIVRAKRALKKYKTKVENGKMTMEQVEQSYRSRKTAIAHCKAWRTQQSMDQLYAELFGGKMYQINRKNSTIIAEWVTWVKKQENGKIIRCKQKEAMGIVKEDGQGYYQLAGKEYLGGDYETVTIEKITPEDDMLPAAILLKQAEIITKQNEQDAVLAAILLKQAQGGK